MSDALPTANLTKPPVESRSCQDKRKLKIIVSKSQRLTTTGNLHDANQCRIHQIEQTILLNGDDTVLLICTIVHLSVRSRVIEYEP